MAILSGAHNHYRGEIFIDGQPIDIHSPRQARQHGIHVVQQEVDVALIPTLSVAENIMLDELADRGTCSIGHNFIVRQKPCLSNWNSS